jgi:hypothetical protein
VTGLALGTCSSFPPGGDIFTCDDDTAHNKVVVTTKEYPSFENSCADESTNAFTHSYPYCKTYPGAIVNSYSQSYCTTEATPYKQYSGLIAVDYIIPAGNSTLNCDENAIPYTFAVIPTNVCAPNSDYFMSVTCSKSAGTATYRYYSDAQCTKLSPYHSKQVYNYKYDTCLPSSATISNIVTCTDP